MLRIRSYIKGKDEALWIDILKEASKDDEDFIAFTPTQLTALEESPDYDTDGFLIAEWDGVPAGCVEAHIDRKRTDLKGYLSDIAVLPEYRRKGIARALVSRALEWFTFRGMDLVETRFESKKTAARALAESFGFSLTRSSSEMVKDVSKLPLQCRIKPEIAIRGWDKGEDDVKLINRLQNETFREHYNYRPIPLDETKYWIYNDPIFSPCEYLLAYYRNEPVGYLAVAIDGEYNAQKKRKAGWVLSIGVLGKVRRLGIGAALMESGMSTIKGWGMEQAMLFVDDLNETHARELYAKLGFKVKSTYEVHIKEIAKRN
jgi:mycothiol synthase